MPTPEPTHHALIDWTAGTITINGRPLPWLILADGLSITHPSDDYPIGTITCTVLADRINLDGIHIELDDETMPWRLDVAGPRVRWMERIWAIELPILVDDITEHGTRPQPVAAIPDVDQADDGYGGPDAEEWGEGECDRCLVEPGEVGPLGICCACSIGQGAPADECECGPDMPVRPGSDPDPDTDRDIEQAIANGVL